MDIQLFEGYLLKRLSFSSALAWCMLLLFLTWFICTWVFLFYSLIYLSIFILILSLFSVLQLQDKSWNQIVWGLQFCSFSKLLWLIWVLCMNFRISLILWQKGQDLYWNWLRWIYISIWKTNGNWCFYLITNNLRNFKTLWVHLHPTWLTCYFCQMFKF